MFESDWFCKKYDVFCSLKRLEFMEIFFWNFFEIFFFLEFFLKILWKILEMFFGIFLLENFLNFLKFFLNFLKIFLIFFWIFFFWFFFWIFGYFFWNFKKKFFDILPWYEKSWNILPLIGVWVGLSYDTDNSANLRSNRETSSGPLIGGWYSTGSSFLSNFLQSISRNQQCLWEYSVFFFRKIWVFFRKIWIFEVFGNLDFFVSKNLTIFRKIWIFWGFQKFWVFCFRKIWVFSKDLNFLVLGNFEFFFRKILFFEHFRNFLTICRNVFAYLYLKSITLPTTKPRGMISL